MSFAARVFIHCLILTGMCLPAAGLAILVLAYGFGKQSLEAMLLPEVIVVSVTIFLLSIALSIISGILLAGTEFFKKQMPVLEEHIKRYVEELIPKLLAQTEMGGYGIDVGVVQKIVETGGSGLFEFGQETGSWFSPGRMLHSWTVKKVVTFFRLSLTEDYMTWLREKDESQATLASLEEFARQRLVGVIVGRLKDQVTSIRTKTIYSVAGFILLPIISAFSLRIYTPAFPGPIGLVTHYGQQIVNARKQIKFPQEFASLKVIADCQPRKRSMKAAKTKAARTRFERTKPHLNVYLVGHSLLDKAALTSAIMLERCKQGFADYFPFELLMEIPEKKKRGLTISTAHVEYESELRHYAHAFTPGLDDDLKNLITGATQMDGVVLLVSSATGITSDLQKMTYLASRYGIDRMVVYLDQSIIELDRPDLQAMVSEIKELMDSNGVAGCTPIIIGSTLKALKSDLSAMGLDSITTLVQAMDEHFPDRIRDIDRPFLMPVGDAFSISGRGTVATGKVEFGHINIGDKVDIVGLGPTRQVTVIGIEMFRKLLDAGQAGDNIGIVLEGISKEDVGRGQVLAAPGSMQAVKTFEALAYMLTLDEGGRVIPVLGYRPQFYFWTALTTGYVVPPEGIEKFEPGNFYEIKVELVSSVAMDTGTQFIIRKGARTVGAGKVIYCPETDQRGVESSIDGDSNSRANFDTGAYEYTQGEPFIVIINDTVTHVTDGNFEVQVIQADLPTLVVFGAPWSGQCKAIEPVIQELAGEYDGKIKVSKMNVDENPATPGKYGIRAIPTVILFKGGQVVDQVVGVAGKSQLVALIDKAL